MNVKENFKEKIPARLRGILGTKIGIDGGARIPCRKD